jgi:hypothetical protein
MCRGWGRWFQVAGYKFKVESAGQKAQQMKSKKPARKKRDVVYVVVWVHRGVIDTVEAYSDEKTAQARAEIFRQDSNPECDDVGVVEVEIGVKSEDC